MFLVSFHRQILQSLIKDQGVRHFDILVVLKLAREVLVAKSSSLDRLHLTLLPLLL